MRLFDDFEAVKFPVEDMIFITHGYYKVTERVGEAFKDGLQLKK